MSKKVWRVLDIERMELSEFENQMNALEEEGYTAVQVDLEHGAIFRIRPEVQNADKQESSGPPESLLDNLRAAFVGILSPQGNENTFQGVKLEGNKTGEYLHAMRHVLSHHPTIHEQKELSTQQRALIDSAMREVFGDSHAEVVASHTDFVKIRDLHMEHCKEEGCKVHAINNFMVSTLEHRLSTNPAN